MTRNELNNNVKARTSTFESVLPPHLESTHNVSYSTEGHLLVMGPEDAIRQAAIDLNGMKSLTLLATDPVQAPDSPKLAELLESTSSHTIYYGSIKHIGGHLGQFYLQLEVDGQEIPLAKAAQRRDQFDLILDLSSDAHFLAELVPAGYFHVSAESDEYQALITELPEYNGVFEKPRYIQVNHDICAHTSRGLTGCTRCLDVCPAEAISSTKQGIDIDLHLCHGAGGCTTACPTGAIHYTLPQPARLLDYIQRLIDTYKASGGRRPTLLFYDHTSGKALVESQWDKLADSILPIQLEELAAAGLEIWLSALAMGASGILLLETEELPNSMKELLNQQLALAHAILTGLGHNTERLQLINRIDVTEAIVKTLPEQTVSQYITPQTDKRDTLFAAIDALVTKESDLTEIALPTGSPFGQVTLRDTDCTLCLSCIAVCPANALTDGGDKPSIRFTEQNCIQCGLCQNACPENVISLTPRLLLEDTRKAPVTLLEEEPYNCISCGKGFAPQRTVEKMIEKLSDHRFFQGDAINRLKMCEDCRVKDIYSDLSTNPEKQLEL